MDEETQLLSADQMQQVDRHAAASGVNTFELMENAGRAVAEQVLGDVKTVSTVLILAGGGNNGGDGFIAAEILRETGIDTTVLAVGSKPAVGSDANKANQYYSGKRLFLSNDSAHLSKELFSVLNNADVIIDALFGAGLRYDISGIAATLIDFVNHLDCPVFSIDLPSGLDGNDNIVKGVAIQATKTVTFFRAKPAHYLLPGRLLCGELIVKQIGLNQTHLASLVPPFAYLNCTQHFLNHLPTLDTNAHKYQRGHVLVRSGPIHSTGAARLSASTALTCGAGVVSLASSNEALAVNAVHLTAVMLAPCDSVTDWTALLSNRKINIAVIGPGNGINEQIRDCVLQSLQHSVALVLDADALSCWQEQSDKVIPALQNAKGHVVLTPHAAEFNRLFQSTDIANLPSKLHQSKAAAKLTNSVVIYKGADTVIASPDGRVSINCNAPPWLATAGSGDVLTGAIAAMHAQGMPIFESCLAAVWLHSQAATTLGYPMTAEQLSIQMGSELNCVYTNNQILKDNTDRLLAD